QDRYAAQLACPCTSLPEPLRHLQYRHLVTPTGLEDRIHIRRLTVKMDDDHGLRQPIPIRPLLERARQKLRVKIPTFPVAVQKYRLRSHIDDRVRRCDKCEGWAKNLIIRLDSQQPER